MVSAFVRRLIAERKIRATEPSADVCASYRRKANRSMTIGKLLLDRAFPEEATSALYYAMYYQALALLFLAGIKSENHAGTIMLLRDLFSIDTASIEHAKRERIEKQYAIDTTATRREVEELVTRAEAFHDEMNARIDRLTEAEKGRARGILTKADLLKSV